MLHSSHRDLAATLLRTGKDVKGYGSMSALHGHAESYGMLPGALVSLLRARRNHVDCVIYSYSTPIAWRDGDAWLMPDVSYSVTTGRQQGQLYKLDALTIPEDCSLTEYERVLAGHMRFTHTPNGLRTIATTCERR